jgi:hypothetical protein
MDQDGPTHIDAPGDHQPQRDDRQEEERERDDERMEACCAASENQVCAPQDAFSTGPGRTIRKGWSQRGVRVV